MEPLKIRSFLEPILANLSVVSFLSMPERSRTHSSFTTLLFARMWSATLHSYTIFQPQVQSSVDWRGSHHRIFSLLFNSSQCQQFIWKLQRQDPILYYRLYRVRLCFLGHFTRHSVLVLRLRYCFTFYLNIKLHKTKQKFCCRSESWSYRCLHH